MTAASAPKIPQSFSLGKQTGMFVLGFASGLPYAVLIGTVYAWLTAGGVDTSTIGILSWAGLAYAFKFLWSPVLGFVLPPLFKPNGRIGRWRSWMITCQAIIVITLLFIANIQAGQQIGLVALLTVLAAFASATQDIAIDAWRIKAAETSESLNILSAIVQFGYRVAAFLGGAGALFFASGLGWQATFWMLATAMGLCLLSVYIIPDVDEATAETRYDITLGGDLGTDRRKYLIPVLIAWAVSLITLFGFMALIVTADNPPSTRNFTLYVGPLIVLACVGTPVLMSIFIIKKAPSLAAPYFAGTDQTLPVIKGEGLLDTFYINILEPMIDLVRRLRYSAILILGLVLTYRYADLVWGAFAYPFYLGAPEVNGGLGHSLAEVGAASKIFGVLMTITGTAAAGIILKFLGRMNSLVIGGVLAALTNLLYADLALGGARIDAFIDFTHLDALFGGINSITALFYEDVRVDERLGRLMTVIAGENLVVGFASVVYVAYISSIVNKQYAAVQYALLASLTMLLGVLGRGYLGELIEERGFAYVFVLTAILGGVGVLFSIAEWVRQARLPKSVQGQSSA